MASKPRSRDISQDEWEKYKDEITVLFHSKTYNEIIHHLGQTYDFHPTRNQFGLQVQKRWKLQKNFKRKLQQDVFANLEAETERPAEILIGNRPISFKKLKKTAVAMLTAQKKQADGNTHPAASGEATSQYTTLKQADPELKSATMQDSLPKNLLIELQSPNQPSMKTAAAITVPPFPPELRQSMLKHASNARSPFAQCKGCLDLISAYIDSTLPLTSPSTNPDETGTLPSVSPKSTGAATSRDQKSRPEFDFSVRQHEFENRVLWSLKQFIPKLREQKLFKHATAESRDAFLQTLVVLQCQIYLASNNLIDTSAMDVLFTWISRTELLWVIEILIDSQLPSMAIFGDHMFCSAVAMQDTPAATALIAKGIDPNCGVTGGFGHRRRPLELAIKNGDEATVLVLLKSGAKVNNRSSRSIGETSFSRDIRIATDLDIASKGPHLHSRIIQLLLQHGADVNTLIGQTIGYTSLLNRALRWNETTVIKEVLKRSTPMELNRYGYDISALQMAARYCDCETVQMLLEAGHDANVPVGSQYNKAIDAAVEIGNLDFFITPLQHAAYRNDTAMAKVLLDHGASVDGFEIYQRFPNWYDTTDGNETRMVGKDKSSPFKDGSRFAQRNIPHLTDGNENRMVTEETSSLNKEDSRFFARRSDYYSPIQAAAAIKSVEMVHLLLEHGPNLNTTGSIETSLQVACIQPGNIEVVKLLVDGGALVNSPAHPKYGQTALQLAIASGDTEVIEYLLDGRADINANPGSFVKLNALQAAVKMGNVQLVTKLLSLGATDNDRRWPFSRNSPLNLATRSGNMELFNLLISDGANFEQSDWYPVLLLDAVASGNHAMVERILSSKAVMHNPRALHSNHAYVATAVKQRKHDMVKLLLDFGARPNVRDDDGMTPLRLAIRQGMPDTAKMLVAHKAHLNAASRDSSSPLTDAIRSRDEDLVDFLLTKGAQADCTVLDTLQWPLVAAIEAGHYNILDMIFRIVSFLKEPSCSIACPSLLKAIDLNWMGAVKMLLNWGLRARHISADQYVSDGPLHKAIRGQDHEIINMLLDHDMAFYSKDPRALLQAVRIDDLQLVRRLLTLRSDFHYSDSYSPRNDALKEALSHGKFALSEALITAGASVNEGWSNDESKYATCMLNLAVMSMSVETAKLCIERGANVDGPLDTNPSTPLQCAAKVGSSEMVRLLLDSGANVNARGDAGDGRTALETAAKYGRLDIAHMLIEHDKQRDTVGRRAWSAATFAATTHGFRGVAKFLKDWKSQHKSRSKHVWSD